MSDSLIRLSINPAAVAENYNIVARKISFAGSDPTGPGATSDPPAAKTASVVTAGACSTSAVVKANCYGLGVPKIAPILYQEGCRHFYVATLDEAVSLRQLLGKEPRISMLDGFWPREDRVYNQFKISPVLSDISEVRTWRRSRAATNGVEAALHFDTGMNRLGIPWQSASALAEEGKISGLNLILSHFACADESGHPLTETQFSRFTSIMKLFPYCAGSLCNSYGIFADSRYHLQEVRPGMCLYGLNPVPFSVTCSDPDFVSVPKSDRATPSQPERVNPMKSVIGLKARILQLRPLAKGETIGYGASYRLSRPGRIACVAIGYADGLPRSLGNKGLFFWRGLACPVRGRVSMDTVNVEIPHDAGQKNAAPKVGDWLDIICAVQGADALAQRAGTIGYEILTSLGNAPRIHKDYVV